MERVGIHPQIFRRSIDEAAPSEDAHDKTGVRGEIACQTQLQDQNGTTIGIDPASVDNTLCSTNSRRGQHRSVNLALHLIRPEVVLPAQPCRVALQPAVALGVLAQRLEFGALVFRFLGGSFCPSSHLHPFARHQALHND